MRWAKVTAIFFSVMMATVVLQSCGNDPVPASHADMLSSTSADGEEITFAPHAPQLQQFTFDTVREAAMKVPVTAPVHNLVSVIKSNLFDKKLYFFETQDITDLYSNYLTSAATLNHSLLALQRTKDLYAHGIAATKDLQDAEQDYALAQSSLADNVSRLRAVGIDPKRLEQTAAGVVWAIADIPEGQVNDIKVDARASLTYDAYPDERFEGRISSMGEVVDPSTRKVRVRITLTNPEGKLHPGMFGTAYFYEGPWKVVEVPTTAVVREGDGTMTVWVTPDGHDFMKRNVSVGMQVDNHYQILSGLRPGEHIVAMGGIFLSNMAQTQPSD